MLAARSWSRTPSSLCPRPQAVPELRGIFKQVDADGSGRVTRVELTHCLCADQELLERLREMGVPLLALFMKFATDRNAKISEAEFIALFMPDRSATLEWMRVLRHLFRRLDTDGNNAFRRTELLTKLKSDDEMLELITCVGLPPDLVFELLDLDRDGQISEEEFVVELSHAMGALPKHLASAGVGLPSPEHDDAARESPDVADSEEEEAAGAARVLSVPERVVRELKANFSLEAATQVLTNTTFLQAKLDWPLEQRFACYQLLCKTGGDYEAALHIGQRLSKNVVGVHEALPAAGLTLAEARRDGRTQPRTRGAAPAGAVSGLASPRRARSALAASCRFARARGRGCAIFRTPPPLLLSPRAGPHRARGRQGPAHRRARAGRRAGAALRSRAAAAQRRGCAEGLARRAVRR